MLNMQSVPNNTQSYEQVSKLVSELQIIKKENDSLRKVVQTYKFAL